MSIPEVEHAIVAALDETAVAVEPVASASADIVEPLRSLATGGKRLRARLLLASHAACGGAHDEAAHHIAAAVELFQTAALVHDDVLDQAQTRRGAATIHRQLSRAHRSADWEGDAEHFGVSGAILAGDIALMAAHRTVCRATALLDSASGVVVSSLFAQMSQLCTAGQYADMRLAVQPIEHLPQQEAEIMAMMRSKTASYTAEFPLALGAACAGADSRTITAMRSVGVPLGLAFQLRDDVLGLVGRPDITGKPAGDDIREGKRTLIMVHAWDNADSAQRRAIEGAFARSEAHDGDVAAAVVAVQATGAIEAVEHRLDEFAEQARAALESVAPMLTDAEALADLRVLLSATTQRAA